MRKMTSKIYWFLQRVLRKVIGTSVDELKFYKRDTADVREGFSNLEHPYRKWLASRIIDKVSDQTKYKILELGCGWGPNLVTLSQQAPCAQLIGIDISPASIKEGNRK